MTEETLSYEYSFVCNENEVRIVMTAGLLNRLLQSVGGIQGLDEFMLNPEVQEKFLKTILQDYDEKGNIKGEKCSLFAITPEVSTQLLGWGFDHCANFTQTTALRMKMTTEKVLSKVNQAVSQATKVG